MAATGLVLLFVAGCRAMNSQRPSGPPGSRLPPCPDSPNCVGSEDPIAERRVEPFPFEDAPDAAFGRLRELVSHWPRARIAEVIPGYLRAEFRSALWGFIDDVEFRLDLAGSCFQVRSAARVGYSDFGVNRRRLEKLRTTFHTSQPDAHGVSQ